MQFSPVKRRERLLAGALAMTVVVFTIVHPSWVDATESRRESANEQPRGLRSGEGELSKAERLTIKFQGYAELSGDYRVGAGGAISVPVLGRVQVQDMDPADLEAELSRRLTKFADKDAFVSVEIAEYRPVVVTGYVSKSGAVPWMPGMSVLQAIALAGGVFRPMQGPEAGAGIGIDAASPTRLKRALTEQKNVLAALARLYAERDGATKIKPTERLIKLVGKAEAEQLIAAQSSVFDSSKTAYEGQLAALQSEIALDNEELGVLEKKDNRANEFVGLRQKVTEGIEILRAKGLTRNEQELDQRVKLAQYEDTKLNITVSIARLKSTILTKQNELTRLDQVRRASIDSEIVKLERDAALLDIDIEAAQTANVELTGMAVGSPAPAEEARFEIMIVRRELNGQKTIAADQFTDVEPGDIIVLNVKEGSVEAERIRDHLGARAADSPASTTQ